MALTASGIDTIRESHPRLHVALKTIVDAVNKVGQTAGIGPNNVVNAPTNTGQLSVRSGDGVFDVAIQDPNPARGENYFLEWDNDPSFANAKVIHLGPTRNWRGFLGSSNTYWRYHKQYVGSNVSSPVVFGGSTPQPVAGGGTMVGPTPHPTQGSGTSKMPGKGFGDIGPNTP